MDRENELTDDCRLDARDIRADGFPVAEAAKWSVRALAELQLSPDWDGDTSGAVSAEQAAFLIPPAVTTAGEVLAGERQLQIARALGWSHMGVRQFADASDPAVVAQVAWEKACEGTPSYAEQSAYLRQVVRPIFEQHRELTRTANAANARTAKHVPVMPTGDVVNVAESASSRVVRTSTLTFPAPIENEVDVADSATSTAVSVGPWREVMASHLVGVGRDAMEKFQQMEAWAADPDLTDVGRKRIQKEIDAADSDRKVNPHYLAAQKIHLAETATEEERRAALRFRTLRQFDEAVTALDRFVARTPPAEFAELVRSSRLDVEALEEEQVPAAYRVLGWVDEVAELVRAMKRAATA